jgi:hypothetical protein
MDCSPSLASRFGPSMAVNLPIDLLDEQMNLLEPLLKLVSGNAALLGIALRATDETRRGPSSSQ